MDSNTVCSDLINIIKNVSFSASLHVYLLFTSDAAPNRGLDNPQWNPNRFDLHVHVGGDFVLSFLLCLSFQYHNVNFGVYEICKKCMQFRYCFTQEIGACL